MFVIPSLYIKDNETMAIATGGRIFDKDPVKMAKILASVGTERLYIVDLNVPPSGNVQHGPIIKRIVDETGFKVYLSGHIRSADVVERYISAGVEKVIPGVVAYQKPDFLKAICKKFPGKVGVHIEVRGGRVVITGWAVASKKTAIDYAEQFKDAGASIIIYSDVEEDGKITNQDIIRVGNFIKASPLPVIHSSDVSSSGELELILGLRFTKLIGTIIGRSMYSGIIDISSTITHAKEKMPDEMDEPTLIPE